MKRKLFLPLLLLALVLTACGKQPTGPWQMDRDNHWISDANGKERHKAAHTVEGDACTVCGAVISTHDDELWVQTFNDHGDETLWLIYDGDTLTQNSRKEYTYDEDGTLLSKAEYLDGAMVQEITYATYAHRQETITYAAVTTTYRQDGTRLVEECDESGPIQETLYQGDKVLYDYTVVCTYDKNGRLLTQRKLEGDKVVHETVCTRTETGQLKGQKIYENGKLVQEDKYRQKGEVWTLYQRTTYDESGKATTINYDKVADILDLLKKH